MCATWRPAPLPHLSRASPTPLPRLSRASPTPLPRLSRASPAPLPPPRSRNTDCRTSNEWMGSALSDFPKPRPAPRIKHVHNSRKPCLMSKHQHTRPNITPLNGKRVPLLQKMEAMRAQPHQPLPPRCANTRTRLMCCRIRSVPDEMDPGTQCK